MPKLELPISEGLYPVPVVLVSCRNKKSAPNIITIAWCGVVCSTPPMISVSVRPSRHSHSMIRQAGDFVVNVPSSDMIKQTDLCGIVSGAASDKFKLCNFTEEPSSKISSPMIKECPVNIECALRDTVRLGSHDMFIGQVMAIHADSDIVKNGRIDAAKAMPFVYIHGEYWDVARKIGYYGFSRA